MCKAFEINNDDGDQQQPEDYFDFLQGALELLLGVRLRQQRIQTEAIEVPHFLGSDGNEYFFGSMVFVAKNELSVSAVGPHGQQLDLTEEQREAVMGRAFRLARLEWTEEDQAWYDGWISAGERGCPWRSLPVGACRPSFFKKSGVIPCNPERNPL